MGVVEAREDQLPACINNTRPGAGQRPHIGRRTDRRDPFAEDRQSVRRGVRLVHGVDGGIEDDEIGSEWGFFGWSGGSQHGARDYRDRNERFHWKIA